MRDFQQTRVAILNAATDPDSWQALDLLPEAPTKDGAVAGVEAEDWAEASFGDLVLGLEYCRFLLQQIANDKLRPLLPIHEASASSNSISQCPIRSSTGGRGAVEHCGDAARQCVSGMRDRKPEAGTHPDDTELIQLAPKMRGWADERAVVRCHVICRARELETGAAAKGG
jgi:hypothetical protein